MPDRSDAVATEPGPRASWPRSLTGVAVCGQLLVMLDVAVVNVALPAITWDLDFTTDGVQWVASAYSLTFAGLLLAGGRATDVYGGRRVFLTGAVVFIVASVLGGLATDAASLIAARALQGAGAALLSPATLAVISTELAGIRRQRAIGAWAAMSGVGGGLGVFLGGVLTGAFSWRWVLLINVPIGLVTVAGALVALPRSRTGSERRLDIAATTTITIFMVAVVLGVINGGSRGWSVSTTMWPFFVAALALAAFVYAETRKASDPVLPLEMINDWRLISANIVVLLVYAVTIAPWFVLSFYMQSVLLMSPASAGLGLLPQAVVIASVAQLGARLSRSYSPFLLMGVGSVFAAAGLTVMAMTASVPSEAGYVGAVLIPLLLLGVAIGLVLPAGTFVAANHGPGSHAGAAAGLLNVCRQFGGVLGLAIIYTAATRDADRLGQHLPSGYRPAAIFGIVVACVASVISAVNLGFRRST